MDIYKAQVPVLHEERVAGDPRVFRSPTRSRLTAEAAQKVFLVGRILPQATLGREMWLHRGQMGVLGSVLCACSFRGLPGFSLAVVGAGNTALPWRTLSP